MPRAALGLSTAVPCKPAVPSTGNACTTAPANRLFPLAAVTFDYRFTAEQISQLTGDAERDHWEENGRKKFRAEVGDDTSLRVTDNVWGKTYSIELWINDPTVLSQPRGAYARVLEIISAQSFFVGGD